MSRSIENRARFDLVRYANCWEDAAILCKALKPAPGKHILSIASGGDNTFAMLSMGASVVAADISTAQLACVELKAAAIRRLEHADLLSFIGIRPCSKRLPVFEDLKPDLSRESRDFWEHNAAAVESGIVHAGKFENYFHIFRKRILPMVHSRQTVAELMRAKDRSERESFYNSTWNNLRWRLLFRIFFSRPVMGRLGRDPEFFRYVEGSVSDRILRRTKHALTVLPTNSNPYLDYILNGNFTCALPLYLEERRFESLRKGLDNLTIFRGPIQEAVDRFRGNGFDGFNLSDIFEYMDADLCAEIYAKLLESAGPRARFAYWNMLVSRQCPEGLKNRVEYLAELSRECFEQDMAFFYSAFIVEEKK